MYEVVRILQPAMPRLSRYQSCGSPRGERCTLKVKSPMPGNIERRWGIRETETETSPLSQDHPNMGPGGRLGSQRGLPSFSQRRGATHASLFWRKLEALLKEH
ncbi:hypothetical protein AAFF_G00437510 [Aldrovandia affinis]|uniref:Uncharacterized protein n=1 Tax=Aldrovandia affinis TaxID=143900 RepID=A0AAD7S7N1_9TELE|nr:hypothetical protein AAFF_G00437510 [Aldrovandia affinis]